MQPIIRQWTENLFTEMEWRADDAFSFEPGEAGGFIAVADGFPYKGYLKPVNPSDHTNHPRAANEKIVSDLAARLGLSVSPVLLYRRNNCPENHDTCACVSLIVYPEQFEMSQMRIVDGPVREIVNSVVARSSGIIALDTYVGNMDRNSERNIVFGFNKYHPAESSFVFLDYSNSLNMNNRWANQGWRQVDPPPIYEPFQNGVDINNLMETVQMLEALPDELLRYVVTRIPEDYVPGNHKNIIVEGLMGRRQLIRNVISNRFIA